MPINEFRAIYLPYCIKKIENDNYVVLNRNYKPLGFQTNENLNYNDYPITTKFKGLTEKKAIELSWNNSPDTDNIFLYNDATNPRINKKNMQDYLKKVEMLSKLKMKK